MSGKRRGPRPMHVHRSGRPAWQDDPRLSADTKALMAAVFEVADRNGGKVTSDDLEDHLGLPRGELRDLFGEDVELNV
jgi:hypothetical protein